MMRITRHTRIGRREINGKTRYWMMGRSRWKRVGMRTWMRYNRGRNRGRAGHIRGKKGGGKGGPCIKGFEWQGRRVNGIE